MPQARQLSVSRSNLFWLAIVLTLALSGWIVSGWKVALAAAAVGLVVSEVVERTERKKSLHA